MRGKPHSDEVRAQVMAALLAGQGVAEVAAQYQLDKSTVKNWKRKLAPLGLTRVNPENEDEFGDLLAGYLREVLTTLSVQAEHARDKAWLAKQSGADFALIHGILCDKGIRLLEAAERAAEAGVPDVPRLGEPG